MLNHIYGLAGIAGLIITIATSFLQNEDTSQWLLASSGWAACLIVAISTALGTRRISKALIDEQKAHSELQRKAADIESERDKLLEISAYLASIEKGKPAKSRRATRKPPSPEAPE